ncbi:inorganic phosphate transporter [Kocuria sp. HSID16901]|uniref:inorganic phosphate transporter n=1 Tax=Kocuria sp. HSID16901 TaxID=2419505 RepID=UPI0006615556|nr:inorganic phosphate transporter [Kocuria sp. HSID16901]RUQ21921.1 inorganic phosphate transporter [Kocuria sp. HSID16901]
MAYVLFAVCGVFLLGFTAIVCFHDASNSIAVPVRARALTPKIALGLNAFFNVLGLAVGALTFSSSTFLWLDIPHDSIGLAVLTSSLLTVILWELITWWRRVPSSSTNALFGAIVGALWATQHVGLGDHASITARPLIDVILPLVIAPLAAFTLAWILVIPLVNLFQHAGPDGIHRQSRFVLTLSASAISLGHGIYFGHRVMIIAAMMFLSIGQPLSQVQAMWCCLLLGVMMVIGCLLGSWRISHTIADRLVRIDPFRGAIAQGVTAVLIFLTGSVAKDPFSSSHLAASAVLGAGSNQRFHAVRPHMAARLVMMWAVTLPISAVGSAIFFLALSPLL